MGEARVFTRRLISLSSTKSNLGFGLSMSLGLSAVVGAEGSAIISSSMAAFEAKEPSCELVSITGR